MSEAKEPSPESNHSLEIEKLKQPPIPAPRESIPVKAPAKVEETAPSVDVNESKKLCDKKINEANTAANTKSIFTNGTTGIPAKTILKKSVSFDPEDETVKKFTSGEVIIDQKNPFKKTNGLGGRQKKTPPPVPIKRSTLSSVKPATKPTPTVKEDSEFVTTEEVLKQSKYVKTYIKNPDKYFEYDPTVLARIKFEELKELSGTKPSKKVKLTQQTQERLKDLKKKCTPPAKASKIPNFKKVSKPNYPDLSDIKVKTGTDLEDSLFNPEEVTKNAKKFDERVKKLQISSDDDLEDIDEPLTKSDSSEEVKLNNSTGVQSEDQVDTVPAKAEPNGEVKSFTNTVNSQEFQEFLKKKGLSLTPKRAAAAKTNGTKVNGVIPAEPQRVQIVIEKQTPVEQIYSDPDTIMETPKKTKKPSVFQRLLPNGIFSSKRKTTPKEQVPIPQSVYGNIPANENGNVVKPSPAIKRVVLERQSFHGSSGNGLLNNVSDLKKQMERSRKSYAAGDDHSNSISSALTNADDFPPQDENNVSRAKKDERSRSASEGTLTKANRSRSSSKERLHTSQSRDGLVRTRIQRAQIPISSMRPMPNKSLERNVTDKHQQQQSQQPQQVQLRRSVAERQSLVPKRSTAQAADKRVIFGRSSSMDRNEISKRSGSRLNNSLPKSKSASSTPKGILTPKNSKENLLDGGPKLTSTPIREDVELKKPSPQVAKPSVSPIEALPQSQSPATMQVGQQEWVKLSEIKERTDRELYNKVIQQTQGGVHKVPMSGNPENIYERLPAYQIQVGQSMSPPYQPIYAQLVPEGNLQNFLRGSPQRNTFSGVYRNRNAKIIDGNPVLIPENQQVHSIRSEVVSNQVPRCQSVLDEMMAPNQRDKGYRSDSETPVIMRRKDQTQQRSGTLTREEILQKVKEFCRKSLNKTPTKLGSSSTQINSHKEMNGKVPNDISPVSYVSVETHNRPSSRLAAPQVPQRMQSLPPTAITVSTVIQPQASTPTTSPIYAHVIKRNSIQSNVSDQLDSPQRRASSSADYYHQQPRRLFAQSSETDSGVFGRPDTASPARFVVMDSDKVTPAHLMKYGQYGQVQMPSPYGFIHVKPQQQARPRMDGRATPLILERGNQVGSQIYWSPTRALQHSPRLPVQLSPRYAPQAQQHLNRQQGLGAFVAQPQQQQQQPQQQPNGNLVYVKVQDQIYRPINMRPGSAGTMPPLQQRVHKMPPPAAMMQPIAQQQPLPATIYPQMYESESGSEAGEVQRIMERHRIQEDWQNEKSGRNQSNEQVSDDRRRNARREDPRRHTLGGDMLQYGGGGGGVGGVAIGMGNASGGMGGQGQPQQRAMDLEGQPMRGYAPINQGPLFDEDPGIMSEVETASTGFRRGGKQRSSLPVVRTPSKTLERPLGLVFLQYRSETKRALLPNEITSIDTVRALFVRSFPRQLTMAYLEGPNVKIYIHDASKDMFYELEDVRSHLREIRDRSVLRLFESNEVAAPPQVLPGGPGIPQPLPQAQPAHWDQDQSYFSEPEFDSEYQHQHIHKSKGGKQAPYYVGASQTLPRGMYSDRNKAAVGAPAKPLRSYGSRGSMGPPFSYPPDQLYSIPDGYTSSPERGTRGSYEEPYYSQYGTRGAAVAPIIDEEHGEVALSEDQYALYGMKIGSGRIPRSANQAYDPTRPEDLHRIRVEHMERQLANLTGLVQKALVNQNPQIAPAVVGMNPNYLGVPTQCRANGSGDDMYIREKAPKLGKSSCHKSVSFEKSVSFSDDIQGVPKSHSPQHAADSKPPKPAIKSSTLPRTSSQAERDRLKPPPPPKPLALTSSTHPTYRADITLAPEVYNHLRGLQKKAKDLRMEVRTLRRLSQAQAVAVREDIKDAFMRIRATLLASSVNYWGQGDQEKTRMSREEELYKQEVIRLEKDLSDLESSVEGLRGEVINRRTRVNMAAVEDMALVLSRASKTVAELKMRFPSLQNGLRNILANEMEKVVREEKFLKEEPDRLESALRRCKKLTGTLVTLKRLASVQEQRLPANEPTQEDPPRSAEISSANKPIPSPRLGTVSVGGGVPPENALDALLDELQTFAKPLNQNNDLRPDDSTSDDSSQAIHSTVTTQLSQASLYTPGDLQSQLANAAAAVVAGNSNTLHVNSNIGSLRRLHSYPSGSDTDTSPPQPIRPSGKPPVPERNAELLSKVGNKRVPPPPPPRTSSRSPLASPTSPNIPIRLPSLSESTVDISMGNGDGSGNSSGNESGNDHAQRQMALEMRHQELLKKQKLLQEQYARLQQMSKNSVTMPPSDIMQLKKTGSESNLPQKMGLNMAVTGSMKNLNTELNVSEKNEKNLANKGEPNEMLGNGAAGVAQSQKAQTTTTSKVYETDIL
ncbi:uncharacterized protein LOC129911982 isoform X5 [Episyrphus balteatus]|uniref:uncharacterized protein LOC129911982 isoform X5 n=1 Tax=Episyrphus balteatus TaxID=286459 RepID=UPI002486A71A|nr:uncharacterized protein LOC129911982 isoform X5 [Episyrphus balteatus]